MSTNPPFTVPVWLPTLIFVLAGLAVLLLSTYVMWDAITKLRIQSPVYSITQHGNNNVALVNTSVNRGVPIRLEHDGVVWLDTGRTQYGHIYALGPFCPKDNCQLGLRDRKGIEQVRAGEHNDVVVSNSPYDTFVKGSYNFAILFCHECKTEYVLGTAPKCLGQSREEVETLFEAKRRREAAT